ncbi:MAG: acyl-CoA dehydrogenase family protein, partial [Candidatus Competibacterales bacterium]|nr:acyl-CoA dehydrogenase family protein [Candidatus Competibacterales bacterium]
MIPYHAPTRDMQFVIEELAGLDEIAVLEAFREQEVGADLVAAVLEEAARFAGGVLAPLNRTGDQQPARLGEAGVETSPGFPEAYRQFVEAGWNGLNGPTEHGGQGLPELLSVAAHEMWNSANLSFALCPLLTAGAIEALRQHGTPEQQRLYLSRLVSGEWTGTMNLTEPQAGSDLSAIRTRAVPEGDHYRLHGQKIYITWGDHDVAENVIHLVLARTPDAPEGVKGISLFLVPKVMVNDDGTLGERNDVHCHTLEHKLGNHASPTCVMQYG